MFESNSHSPLLANVDGMLEYIKNHFNNNNKKYTEDH